jgi:radical SAM superfamily enzyme YgiQ (UPF0313 family)
VNSCIDVLFIVPSNREGIYQGLAGDYAAIEPPTWALLLAEAVRAKGHVPAILDTNAEKLTDQECVSRISAWMPRLIVFVAYGQNVNAGTASMSGVVRLASAIKEAELWPPLAVIGSYVQALPRKCLVDEPDIDFVFTNEGVYSLLDVLSLSDFGPSSLSAIRGLAVRCEQGVFVTPGASVVPTERMDVDLPGYAWDLLPYHKQPLDLYRSPYWHAGYVDEYRSPYAAIQTSLGCQFKCTFCMINLINRDDEVEVGIAGNYSGMRFWTPQFVINQLDILVALGVKTIRITDEMFLLNRKYYEPILRTLSTRDYAPALRMWAYSRVDTIRDLEQLNLVRRAGIRWLCLGIESANRDVRLEISKGKFKDVDIREVVKMVHEADIDVLANYIVGLPGEDLQDMQRTLDLSIELCTSGWNMYAAMALPGSQLYADALASDVEVPTTYEGYSFHSYDSLPLPSGRATAAQALRFRDEAFGVYHTNARVLERIRSRFGEAAAAQVAAMTQITLKRRILDGEPDQN